MSVIKEVLVVCSVMFNSLAKDVGIPYSENEVNGILLYYIKPTPKKPERYVIISELSKDEVEARMSKDSGEALKVVHEYGRCYSGVPDSKTIYILSTTPF
jgi:hypothetical protein